jgi:ferritin
MSLKSRILEYINQHKEGVKISDMEKPLGEHRMKIGFLTKILLDEGKIEKRNSQYYPVSASEQDKSVFIRRDYF